MAQRKPANALTAPQENQEWHVACRKVSHKKKYKHTTDIFEANKNQEFTRLNK